MGGYDDRRRGPGGPLADRLGPRNVPLPEALFPPMPAVKSAAIALPAEPQIDREKVRTGQEACEVQLTRAWFPPAMENQTACGGMYPMLHAACRLPTPCSVMTIIHQLSSVIQICPFLVRVFPKVRCPCIAMLLHWGRLC